MNNPGSLLKTNGLSKRYAPGRPWAVHDLNLRIDEGEIFGFVGPNGAGKTTTIKMLIGLAPPTEGGGSIFGLDIVRDSVAIRRRIGFMSGDVELYNHLNGRDLIEMVQRLHGGGSRDRLERLIKQFDIPFDRKIKTYSSGQKQQAAIIAAFAHDSDLLILDEPTKGLDPSRKSDFLELVAERSAEGAAVLISSHVLSEIESICSRVGFIREGELLSDDEITAVQNKLGKLIVATFSDGVSEEQLRGFEGVEAVRRNGAEFVLAVSGDGRAAIRRLCELPLESLRYRRATLEDLYESIYLREKR